MNRANPRPFTRSSRITDWYAGLRFLARSAVDFVYPRACRLCEADLLDADRAGALANFCNACHAALCGSHGPACLACGASIGPHLDPALPCMYCRDEKFAFERVFRLGVYDNALRTACLRAKTRAGDGLAEGLADLFWECEARCIAQASIDVVVPVPQHWTRRVFRGYNAAEAVGRVWARRLQVPLSTSILRKVRRTPPQARLAPSERRVNLTKAFAIREPAPFAGATVLLADDVMTTGTTAHEASRVLRRAGASRVVVAVIARGLGRR